MGEECTEKEDVGRRVNGIRLSVEEFQEGREEKSAGWVRHAIIWSLGHENDEKGRMDSI